MCDKNNSGDIVLSWQKPKNERKKPDDTVFEDTVHSIGASKIALDKVADEGGGEKRSARFQRKNPDKTEKEKK